MHERERFLAIQREVMDLLDTRGLEPSQVVALLAGVMIGRLLTSDPETARVMAREVVARLNLLIIHPKESGDAV